MRHIIILFYAWLVELFRKPLMLSDTTIRLLFIPGFNKIRTFNGKARAYAEFAKAKRRVPAYRDFLKSTGFSYPSFSGMTPLIHQIPFTDKENYVMKFSMDERSCNGQVPDMGVVIDESSGSSGTATNWARGKEERKRNARFIKFGVRTLLGTGPLFIINAFALGPWATGVNITMSCVAFSKLKSLGPDKIKIENTLKHFGKKHHYVIMGYPPFLKLLVDNSEINWMEYNISFIFGGESMSEGMRDYLMGKGIKKVYSSLGASDLELNISAENDFTISIRKLLRSNAKLRERLLKHPGALPMLFQFNPSDFLIESSQTGELLITICRPGYIAPKIRYNIHDRGHILQLKELYSLLKELNIDEKELSKPSTDLPILLHYGRADMTVSFFGANISPTDIQEALYNIPSLVNIINSFCLKVVEDKDGNKQLVVTFEKQKNKSQVTTNMEQTQIDFFEQLAKTNQDFREAKKMLTNNDQTIIRFYDFAQGPFENNDIRIKAKYIN
ncbi:phenylacetate--CoA ligase family protein [soil metagenome]